MSSQQIMDLKSLAFRNWFEVGKDPGAGAILAAVCTKLRSSTIHASRTYQTFHYALLPTLLFVEIVFQIHLARRLGWIWWSSVLSSEGDCHHTLRQQDKGFARYGKSGIKLSWYCTWKKSMSPRNAISKGQTSRAGTQRFVDCALSKSGQREKCSRK